ISGTVGCCQSACVPARRRLVCPCVHFKTRCGVCSAVSNQGRGAKLAVARYRWSLRNGGKTMGSMTGRPLIDSDRVEGTNIYDAQGSKIGSVKRLMIEKLSGRIAYAGRLIRGL